MTNSITLIATIGTRDLMYQIKSGEWYNAGDDRMQDGKIIGEQAEVLIDLDQGSMTFRDLTTHLWQNYDRYSDKIRPVILGGLLEAEIANINQVYLIGTDQDESIQYRLKDTIYACELLKIWLQTLKPNLSVTIVPLGRDGTNPSDFEQMFQWWTKAWQEQIKIPDHEDIWMCLKGGVGQSSESGRISGLSRYGDRIKFFEFDQTPTQNQQGIPSRYRGPFLGKNYLWDRTRQQAIRSLDRYDYVGLKDLLKSYDSDLKLSPLLDAGIKWNQGRFDEFFELAKPQLNLQQRQQTDTFWWQAYEEMYLAVVRLTQDNTIESFLHSYRALEALIISWIRHHYPTIVTVPNQGYAKLIRHSTLQEFNHNKRISQLFEANEKIDLHNYARKTILEVSNPSFSQSQDLQCLWSTANDLRNKLSHQIVGLSANEMFTAWKVEDQTKWQERMLACLNLLSQQKFKYLWQPSLFASIHHHVKNQIKPYF